MAKILIVEDEHIVAWDIQETLEKLGHTAIASVVSGAEAIAAAAMAAPDLVLMDIRLEGAMDGITAGHEIYQQLNIPVVYLTAHADELTLKRATRTNPFGYIVKPFQSPALQTTIQIALERHQLETSAKSAQADLAQTIDSIGGGIIVTDRHGCVTLMNPLAESLTGWQEQAAIGLEIERIFHLIWESDGTAIENPSRRAMRLKQPIQSPEKCWLVARNGDEIPIYDIATPILNSDGEIVGSTLMFQDNTERVLAQVELWEQRNQELKDFQLKSISHLQRETAQHQQAIACIQVLNLVLHQVGTATSEQEILSHALHSLGTTIDADYCWVAVHDRQTATANTICEYAIAGRIAPVSAVGKQIDLQLYPQFYRHLCQHQSWIDPPREILPSLYLDLLIPASRLLVCPIVGAAANGDRDREWTMGEVGIVITGKPTWLPAQAELITQVFSYAIKLFRQNQLKSSEHSWEWLNRLNDDFTGTIHQVDRDLNGSDAPIQQQLLPLDVETNHVAAIEQHRYFHRQLLEYLHIVKAEWRRKLNLIDTLIDFESSNPPPQNLAIGDGDFQQWIERISSNCTIVANRHHQKFSFEITEHLPSTLLCNFPVLESIVMEVFATACRYTPPNRSLLMSVDIRDHQLTLSVVSMGIEISPADWELELVSKLLSYLGGEIQAKSDLGSTRLILTTPI